MDIKTKFNIGDNLFYLKDNGVCSSPVTDIYIRAYYSGGFSVYYSLGLGNPYQACRKGEKELFKTRKALISFLEKNES